ncbi:hypothetical protein EI94DRAFT_1147463 [Lactarius quietus]|nr:hypothetical protein EI94DRAFT_1147463 [Lactarius quietus]
MHQLGRRVALKRSSASAGEIRRAVRKLVPPVLTSRVAQAILCSKPQALSHLPYVTIESRKVELKYYDVPSPFLIGLILVHRLFSGWRRTAYRIVARIRQVFKIREIVSRGLRIP